MSALGALLLFVTPVEQAVDAERTFALAAQRIGQWTAFRQFAADDAILFLPQPTPVEQALRGAPDPVIAVRWWPARSWVSCDDSLAVNTGPWVRAHQDRVGYFVTIWQREDDGNWRWILDDGRDLEAAIPAGEAPEVRRAECVGSPPLSRRGATIHALPQDSGSSRDGTLRWHWALAENESRTLTISLFTGEEFEDVFIHIVPAPRQ